MDHVVLLGDVVLKAVGNSVKLVASLTTNEALCSHLLIQRFLSVPQFSKRVND